MAPKRIGIFLFDGAEELDWAGPWEVLSAWAQFHPEEAEVFTFAREEGPVTCAKGLRVLPQYGWDETPPIEVLVYPGGQGTRAQLGDENIRRWLRGLFESHALITSVCTGSLVLADAGLLNGRPATTHWASLDFLPTLGEDITVKGGRSASSIPARSSPLRGFRPVSTWRCTSSLGSTRESGRPRCAATSSTTRPRLFEPGTAPSALQRRAVRADI